MAYSLGIDVGTTFTAAAIARNGVVEVVSLGTHQVTAPTVIFADGNDIVLGSAALLRGRAQPAGLAREFKRRLGDSVPLLLTGSPYSADRLVALYAKWVVDSVSEQFGERPERVVMTHPANWTEFQLHLLTQSFDEVGMGAALFLSEPEAAAIDFASVAQVGPGEIHAVYDLGGGTFDIALLRKEEDGFSQVGEAAGLERLGGIDFDEAVFRYVIDRLPADVTENLGKNPDAAQALGQLRRACVETKEGLSSEVAVDVAVVLPELSTTVRLTRAEFEDMIRPSLDQSIELVRRTLERAGVQPEEVAGILLVGGSSRIPRVAELVQEELGMPTRIDAHPKLVVARGAARWAASPTRRAAAPPVGRDQRRRGAGGLVAGAVLAVALVAGAVFVATRDDSDETAGAGTNPAVATTSPATTSPATTAPSATSPATTSPATTIAPAPPEFTVGQPVNVRVDPNTAAGIDSLAFDGDEFWLTATTAGQLLRLDQSGQLLEGLSTGPDPVDVAFGEGALWVTVRSQNAVLRFDPTTGGQTDRIGFDRSPVNVAVGAGGVWVALEDVGIARIDPTTLETNVVPFGDPPPGTTEAPGIAGGLFVSDEAVWVARPGFDLVARLDPVSLMFLEGAIPVGDGPDPIAVVDDVIWVGNRTEGSISRIDLETGEEITQAVCGGPAELAVDGEWVWVVCADTAELLLLDASTLERARAVPLGGRPLSILLVDRSLWVTNTGTDEVVRVDLT